MILVNDKQFDEYNIEVGFGKFRVVSCGIERKGIAPDIYFYIGDNIFLELELTFAKEEFENLELNKRINIDDYISDIIYGAEKGYTSLISDNYWAYVTRIDEFNFNIEFFVASERVKVSVNTLVKIL